MSITVVEEQRVNIPSIWRDIVMIQTGWDPADEVIWSRRSDEDDGEPVPLTGRAASMLETLHA